MHVNRELHAIGVCALKSIKAGSDCFRKQNNKEKEPEDKEPEDT